MKYEAPHFRAATILMLVAVTLTFARAASAQTVPLAPPEVQSEYEQLWTQIQVLKTTEQDIPAALYDRFFELEQTLSVSKQPDLPGRGGSLDQGVDACPGLLVTQPPSGSFYFTDAGQTYNAVNDCRLPSCRNGRDLIYAIELVRPTWLQISTCGSSFDTYLCVFADSCCPASVPLFYNDDAPGICGANSLKAAISSCFLDPGLYYVVLDGYNSTAAGHYVFTIQDIPDSTCGANPPIECPANYARHAEGSDEAVCENGASTGCGARYCGDIDLQGDLDVYTFTLTECSSMLISVYANDTPGHSGFGLGLDPAVRLFSDPGCDFPIYWNEDANGAAPDPVGQDSRLATGCLRAGTYWLEVSGNATMGAYELTMDCTVCPPALALSGVEVTHPVPNRNCATWPSEAGNHTYYVWRMLPGQDWVLIGTTYRNTFCETLAGGENAVYQVFDSPCGNPQ